MIGAVVNAIRNLSPQEKWILLERKFPLSKVLAEKRQVTLPEWSTTVGVFALGGVLMVGIWLLDQDGNKDTPAPSSFAQPSDEDELIKARSKLVEAAKAPILQSRAELIKQTLIQRRQEAKYQDILTDKTLTVIELAKPVTMETSTDMGIWVRGFSNRIISGNLVPTYAPGDQAQLKAWYWGHEINLPIKQFVREDDINTHQAVLFAVTSRGDIEYWPVYDSEDPDSPFVTFERNGKSILLGSILTEEGVVHYQAF